MSQRSFQHSRHLALHKTLSFALVHFTVALIVGRLLTGSWLIASAMALIEPACNTVAYFLHERYWLRRHPVGHPPALTAADAHGSG